MRYRPVHTVFFWIGVALVWAGSVAWSDNAVLRGLQLGPISILLAGVLLLVSYVFAASLPDVDPAHGAADTLD